METADLHEANLPQNPNVAGDLPPGGGIYTDDQPYLRERGLDISLGCVHTEGCHKMMQQQRINYVFF